MRRGSGCLAEAWPSSRLFNSRSYVFLPYRCRFLPAVVLFLRQDHLDRAYTDAEAVRVVEADWPGSPFVFVVLKHLCPDGAGAYVRGAALTDQGTY